MKFEQLQMQQITVELRAKGLMGILVKIHQFHMGTPHATGWHDIIGK